MNNSVRVELNGSGVQELLREVGRTVCAECAMRTASACGDGYEYDVYEAETRTIASVSTIEEDPDKILRQLQ